MENGSGSHIVTSVSRLPNGVALKTKQLWKDTIFGFLKIDRDLPFDRRSRRRGARKIGDFVLQNRRSAAEGATAEAPPRELR